MFNPESLVEKLEDLYPDKMVTEETPEFDRAKLAGKVELIQEIREMLEGKDDGR